MPVAETLQDVDSVCVGRYEVLRSLAGHKETEAEHYIPDDLVGCFGQHMYW